MKKSVLLIVVIVLGSAIAACFDSAAGIEFSNVPFWARIAHIVIHLLWGAAIAQVATSKPKE